MSPISPKVPAGQSESQEVEPASLTVPAAQAWQLLFSSYFPAKQGEQEDTPTEETLPSTQGEQDSDPDVLKVAAGQ